MRERGEEEVPFRQNDRGGKKRGGDKSQHPLAFPSSTSASSNHQAASGLPAMKRAAGIGQPPPRSVAAFHPETHFIPGIFARIAGILRVQTQHSNKGGRKKNYHVLLLSSEFFIPILDSQEKKAEIIVC